MLKEKYSWIEENPGETPLSGQDLHPLVEKLILERGLAKPGELTKFLEGPDPFHDPFLFKDMEKAVGRIKDAVSLREPILIYGDYDADGVTGTAILMRRLKALGAKADYLIPNRFDHGYGPHEGLFKEAAAAGIKLLITVDNGISGLDQARALAKLGVDLIVTDHHHPQETLPEAFAILHPELDDSYPFSYLSGAGVALKLAEALAPEGLAEDDYLIAALGTVGDIVTLTDENRSIVKRGLKALRRTRLPGLLALMKEAGTSQAAATETSISFEICPRLNAPGRLGEAAAAVALLLAEESWEAADLAAEIEAVNTERKALTEKTVAAAQALVTKEDLEQKQVLVLYQAGWHEGILGIVAGKLAKLWNKAVFVMTQDRQGLSKGSAGAVEGYQLFDLLTASQELLAKFGGHALAAGLSLETASLAPFEEKMNQLLAGTQVQARLAMDLEIPLEEATLELIRQLEVLAPFGEGNRKPLIKIPQVEITEPKTIGNKSQHLKFIMTSGRQKLAALFWGEGPLLPYLASKGRFDVAGILEVNEWNGRQSPQLVVSDLRCLDFQVIDVRNTQRYDAFKPLLGSALYSSDSNLQAPGEAVADFVIDEVPASWEGLLDRVHSLQPGNVILAPLEKVVFPSREQFKTVFGVLKKYGSIQRSEGNLRAFGELGVEKNELIFILAVFSELKIVIMEGVAISLSPNIIKTEFAESPLYRLHEAKARVFDFMTNETAAELLVAFNNIISR